MRTYWSLEARGVGIVHQDREYIENFRRLLQEVIADYLPEEGEVPALALSGGLDSSALAAMLSGQRSFLSVCWESPELPEIAGTEDRLSRGVRQYLGIRNELRLRLDEHWPLRFGNHIESARDQPCFLAFPGCWRQTFLETAGRRSRVMFTGSGGDHLTGDSVPSYADLLLAGRWRDLAHGLGQHRQTTQLSALTLLYRHVLHPLLPQAVRGGLRRMGRGDSAAPPWLGKRARFVRDSAETQTPPGLPPGRRQRYRLLKDPRIAWIFPELTQLAAGFGIEMRYPYFDRRLVEFALSLPSDLAYRGGVPKWIVREAMKNALPTEVLEPRPRVGFASAVRRGLLERETARVWNLIQNMRAADLGLVDERRLRASYRGYLNGQRYNPLFGQAIALESWLRRWFS